MSDMTTLSGPGPGAAGDVARPTMRDVAALARVGIKTVSRVINGEPGVSPEMGARVQRAIEQLGYQRHLAASSLRRTDRKTATIGTILADVANPFSGAVQRAVENVARLRGTMVFASSADEDGANERALVTSFVARRVDGLVLVPANQSQSYLQAEIRSGLRVVCVDRPPRFLDVDAVVCANRDGARVAVRHLIAGGHVRIAFLGDQPTIWTAAEREAGYLSAMAESGIPVDPTLVRHGVGSVEQAAASAAELLALDAPPTALFTAQNLITEGAVLALKRLGRQHAVALVGFDDFPIADLLDPGVTVVAQDPARIGEEAATMLFRRLGGDTSPTRLVEVPTTLIVRGSGEIPAPRS